MRSSTAQMVIATCGALGTTLAAEGRGKGGEVSAGADESYRVALMRQVPLKCWVV